jgi:hypothetical protein
MHYQSAMRATKIEVRTKSLRAGKNDDHGNWIPAGQLIATVYVVEPTAAGMIARRIERCSAEDGEEEVVAEVMGRQATPIE